MDIEADFRKDIENMILEEIKYLKKLGFQFDEKMSQDDIIIQYFNLIHRVPVQKSREIKKCTSFSCPKELKDGLSILEEKMKNGENLLPHLSRGIVDATNRKDYMFYDFGLTHFHLGKNFLSENPLLIEGTKEIVYALLNDKDCYLIRIDDHGKWNDLSLLESLKKDFPEALEPFKIFGEPVQKLTEKERRYLVENQVNTPIEIGGEYYMSPGFGVSGSGTALLATMKKNSLFNKFSLLEINIKEQLQLNLSKIEETFDYKLKDMNLIIQQTEPLLIYDTSNELYIDTNPETGCIRIKKSN
jgi:hypothetical protein